MYAVRTCECTSWILKNLALRFQNYSELYLAVPPPTPHPALQSVTCEGWTGDSDL